MNRILLILLLIMCMFGFTKKSHAQSNSVGVTFNIRFHPVQTIEVNPSQKEAELSYITREDYETGVAATYDNHLAISSTGGFQVSVVAGDVNFSSSSSNEVIPVRDIVVSAVNGTDNTMPNTFNYVTLSTKPESLISSERGGRGLNYNVTYDNTAAGSAGKYLEGYAIKGKKETIYRTEITYTITSK